MSIHATRPTDPDKALCGVRISAEPEKRASAALPDEITCNVCAIRLVRIWQADGLVDMTKLPTDRWPWRGI